MSRRKYPCYIVVKAGVWGRSPPRAARALVGHDPYEQLDLLITNSKSLLFEEAILSCEPSISTIPYQEVYMTHMTRQSNVKHGTGSDSLDF